VLNDSDTSKLLQAIFPDHAQHAIFANARYNPTTRKLDTWQHFRDVKQLDGSRDCFMSPAAFPDDGIEVRTGDRVTEVRALVIDDVGGRIPQADVLRGLGQPPTFEVLTSEGNAHWWYLLAKPVPAAEWRAFFAEVERLVGHDLDGAEPHHVFRLPMGVNTKAKRNGFKPCFGQTNPGVTLDADKIMLFAALKPAAVKSSGGSHSVRDIEGLAQLIPNPDSLLRKAWVDRAFRFRALAVDDAAAWRAFELWSKKNEYWYSGDDTEKLWRKITPDETSGKELLTEAQAADPEGYKAWLAEESKAAFPEDTPPASGGGGYPATHVGMAEAIIRASVGQLGWQDSNPSRWMGFSAGVGRWIVGAGDEDMREVVRLETARRATCGVDAKVGREMASSKWRNAVCGLLKAEKRLMLAMKDFDANPDVVGLPSGTFAWDKAANRMLFSKGAAAQRVTMATAVQPLPLTLGYPYGHKIRAGERLWKRFLDDFTSGDKTLEAWWQAFCGYCLTGSTKEQIVVFVYGPGGNGKSLFLNTITEVMGDYACPGRHELVLAKKHGSPHMNILAVLRGKRLVTCQDLPHGAAWDTGLIKLISGGGGVPANRMHEDTAVFTPQFKLVMAGNDKPKMDVVDDAVRRRFRLVPAIFKPEIIDKGLEEKLREVHPEVLRWMMDGLETWKATGLPVCKAIETATDAYLVTQDVFGRWVGDALVMALGDKTKVRMGDVWKSWDAFRVIEGAYGVTPNSPSVISTKLTEMGFDVGRDKNGAYIIGVSLKKTLVDIF
jgi:P4 family phage/plasmid primase-like protien